jgi:predicted ATPase
MISKTNQDLHKNLNVISGGPGVGKTILPKKLNQYGFEIVVGY